MIKNSKDRCIEVYCKFTKEEMSVLIAAVETIKKACPKGGVELLNIFDNILSQLKR